MGEGKQTGAISFDYGAKTFSFGQGIDDAEAGQLIGELKRRQNFVG